MTDPAVEAARRANLNYAPRNAQPLASMVDAAREALKPIRELHRRGVSGMCWSGCVDEDGYTQAWPCDTAKLAYPESEL